MNFNDIDISDDRVEAILENLTMESHDVAKMVRLLLNENPEVVEIDEGVYAVELMIPVHLLFAEE